MSRRIPHRAALRCGLLATAGLLAAALPLAAGPAQAQAAPQTYTSYTRYDALGRVTGTIAPDADGAAPYSFIAVRNSYDTAGNLWKVEKGVLNAWQAESVAPANWGSAFTVQTTIEATFDAMGHKLTERAKDSGLVTVSLTQFSYTPAGSLECTAVRMNPAAFATPPASACTLGTPDTSSGVAVNDRITKNVYAGGDPTRIERIQQGVGLPSQRDYVTYTYTANGKQASVTDARGLKASYTFDGFDRLKVWAMPSPTYAGTSSTTDKEEYRYDANGNMTERWLRDHTAANTSQIVYTYDALNRQLTRTPTGETPLYSAYDLRGLKTGDWTGDGKVVSYGYDGFGRLTVENAPGAGVMIHSYDANGNRTRQTWGSDGFYVDYDYDQLNRITKVRETGASSGIGVLASYAYNADGSRSAVSYSNGTQRLYEYDSAGRVRGVKLDLAGTASDLTIGKAAGVGTPIGYNPAGQVTLLTRTNPTDAYAWTAHSLFERDYAVNGLNQYTNAGGVTFGYDLRGNLTGSGTSNYTYNRLNQLTSGPNGSGGTVQLGYDPAGRLGEVTAGSATTRLLYAGVNLVGEVGATGTILRRYVHGPGTDEPVVWYEGPGTTNRRWLQSDQLGSVVAVSDGAGAMLGINRYDEYGIPQAGNLGRFQYTGQTWWGELGMYNYKARWYSATLGRFMQVDPIGYKDQLNLYAYVGNDPVNGVDPTGLAGDNPFDCTGTRISGACGGTITASDPGPKGDLVARSRVEIEGRPGTDAYKRDLVTKAGAEANRLARDVMGRTAADKYSREYGYTLHLDSKSNELVSRVFQGEDGGVSLDLSYGGRSLIQAGHVHNGIVAPDNFLRTLTNLRNGTPSRSAIQDGPSRVGDPNDVTSRAQFPNASFVVFQQRGAGTSIGSWEQVKY